MSLTALDHLSPPPQRDYRWTLARQRSFLEHFAISGSVTHAAAHVGVSPRAAYDLRCRRDGLLFGIGWGAAVLIARYRLTDLLLERAIDGVEEVAVRTPLGDDGATETRRRKYDGRLGLGLLARLDRMTIPAADADPHDVAMHRIVAQDFESFLDHLSPPPAAPPVDPQAAPPADALVSDEALVQDNATPIATQKTPDTFSPPTSPAPTADLSPPLAPVADADVDALARVTAHLAAQAGGASPLSRLAQETGLHSELAPKTATPEKVEEEWKPRVLTDERSRELREQIYDCLDRMEEKRLAAGHDPIWIKWDCIEMSVALNELGELPEDCHFGIGVHVLASLHPYSMAWQDIELDDEQLYTFGPLHPFSARDMWREDSILGRIERLIAEGEARAVPRTVVTPPPT